MDQQSTLLNVDILDEIFQWFDYEVIHGHPLMDLVTFKGYKSSRDVEVVRRRSLASASRVCKAFHEPALRVLWRQLESLMPLFSVIEPSFTKVQEDAEQPYDGSFCDTYVSSVSCTPSDCARHSHVIFTRHISIFPTIYRHASGCDYASTPLSFGHYISQVQSSRIV